MENAKKTYDADTKDIKLDKLGLDEGKFKNDVELLQKYLVEKRGAVQPDLAEILLEVYAKQIRNLRFKGIPGFLKILLDPSQDFTGRLTIALDGRPEIKTVTTSAHNQMVGEDIMRYMGQLQNGQN